MKRTLTLWLALMALPAVTQAQQAPVADALRFYLRQFKNNLIAAADDMPVANFRYKPTNPQTRGGYRSVRVEAQAPGFGKLQVRTRSGYYAGEKRASR